MELGLGLSQKKLMVPQMVQSLNILQMNTMELEQYINAKALENPVIETIDSEWIHAGEANVAEDTKVKIHLADQYENSGYYRSEESYRNFENIAMAIKKTHDSLYDILHLQILDNHFSKQEQIILEYIINNLDKNGYYVEKPETLAKELAIEIKTAEKMLQILQGFEPAGVGARDLKECLLIQVNRDDSNLEIRDYLKNIIENYLELIAKNHISVLAGKLHCPVEIVEECCSYIKRLNPKPSNRYNNYDYCQYVFPEIMVTIDEGIINVAVNTPHYSKIRVNSYYLNLAKNTDDKETKEYLKKKLGEAKNLKDGIRYREDTVSRVAKLLVERQKEFFLYGPGNMKPLKLVEFADKLDLHLSTVSRAMSSKYLQCSWGIFPLNHFLTGATVSSITGEDITREQILERIEQIIATEDKRKPLSDQKIAELLKRYKLDISRRTVCKYRMLKGIPDRSGRKMQNE